MKTIHELMVEFQSNRIQAQQCKKRFEEIASEIALIRGGVGVFTYGSMLVTTGKTRDHDTGRIRYQMSVQEIEHIDKPALK